MPNTSINNLPSNSYPNLANQQCAACQSAPKPLMNLQANTNVKKDPVLKMSPLALGAINFGAWTGLGYLLDRGVSKLFGTNVPKLGSLALSGVIGLYLGYHSYKTAKKMQQEVNSFNKQA